MINPFKLMAIYNDLNKLEGVTKEKASMNVKIAQVVALLVQVLGLTGASAVAGQWVSSHLLVIVIVNAVLVVGHALLPSLIPGPVAPNPTDGQLNKAALLLVALLLAPMGLRAQATSSNPAGQAAATDIQNLYAAGVSYNAGASPAVAGTGLYAHLVANTGTYAFTAIDALPNTLKPLTVNTNIGVGVAQKVATVGSIPVYVPTAAGISFNGSNTGWQWNVGALAAIKLKGNYYLMPSVRLVKSSVSNGTGYQPIIGVLVGWGK